jgi:hypothetical protein
MSLGDLLIRKKSDAKAPDKKAQPAPAPAPVLSRPDHKLPIEKVEVAQRSRYRTGLMREYKDPYKMNLFKRKEIVMNGEVLDKKKLLDFYAKIANTNRRDVTVEDIMKRLQYYQRYGIKMSWYDKKRFSAWIKEFAKAKLPPEAKKTIRNTSAITPSVAKDIARREERGARKVQLGVPQKFISPKNMAANLQSSFAHLGISGVKDDFQRGHQINPQSIGMSEAGKAKEMKAQGITQGGPDSITRGNPGELGASRVSPGPRKFL